MILWRLFALMLLAGVAYGADPELGASLNGGRQATIEPGWPLMADVEVHNAADQELVLAPVGATWVAALGFAVTDGSGTPSTWSFAPATDPPSTALRLPARSVVRFTMVRGGNSTESLAPGTYVVVAQLEVRDGEGWRGKVESLPMEIVVHDAGSSGEDALRGDAITRARIAAAARRHGDAITALKAFLAMTPDDVGVLRLVAELYEASGNDLRAYVYAARALAVLDQAPVERRAETERQLSALQGRLWRRLAAGDLEQPSTTTSTTTTVQSTTTSSAVTLASTTTTTITMQSTTTSSTVPLASTTTTLPPCSSTRCRIEQVVRGPACATARLPKALANKLARALDAVDAAQGQPVEKARRAQRKARALLQAVDKLAARAAKGKKPALSAECAAALQEAVRRARSGLGRV